MLLIIAGRSFLICSLRCSIPAEVHVSPDAVLRKLWLCSCDSNSPRTSLGKQSVIISAKPDGVGGCVSALDSQERTIWIADAHRYGKRFVVRADEKLTAFLELEVGHLRLRRIGLTGWRDSCQTRRC